MNEKYIIKKLNVDNITRGRLWEFGISENTEFEIIKLTGKYTVITVDGRKIGLSADLYKRFTVCKK